ncbi:cell wall-binding repeat-containing protein, partial [Peptostreptococcus anaerobius]|uniref:cell wall-binding repeat-containing protein n=1 Tax=Peptostreptococcus anaerobius TaxID=1261 RepID=UPI00254EB834
NGLYGKSYAVFKDSKLAKDKFPTPEAADNFKEAKWNVEKPWDQAITKNTTFTAKATAQTTEGQTDPPTINAPKAGDRTISGTGIVGAKVSITKEDKNGGKGSPIARDVIVGNDGKWTANVPDGVNLEEGDTILAIQKENGKDESDQAQATVRGKEDTTEDPVIPFEPTDPENPGDKDDPNIPTENPEDKKPINRDEYVVVGFKASPDNSGTLTLGELKNKAVISALVKKDTEWAKFTMPTPNDANNYVFWHWDTAPAGNVADGQVRVAKFIKSGDEIDPNDNNPLPTDFHKVTVAKGTGIADNKLFEKTYAVKKGETLAHGKFPTLKVTDATQYKDPAWNVANPWTVAVADNDLTFTAVAVSAVFDKDNVIGMVVKTQPELNYVEGNATKGKLDLSKLVVTLTDKNGNTQDVPFDKLGDYGITTNPGNGTDMTVDGNNGKPVVLTKGDLTANTDNLVVTKDNTTEEKSEKPIIDRPTEGDDKITGEGKPGANIVVKDKYGNKIGEAEVNDKGKWEVPVPKDKPLKENDKITVEQTEKGKKPNTAETTVKGKKTPTPSRPSRPSTPSTPDRVHGKDRVETAIDISKKYFGKANTVIVVDKKDFPDAMTASVLSKLLKAPILLTDTNKLDPRVAAEIQRLGAKDVIVVGGNKSVSEAVKKELAKFDKDTVERIYGRDRYETSAQVARRVVGITGKLGHAVVASGQVFADALTVAPYASREGYPILLVRANNLPKSVKDAITELAINKVTIAGGYTTVNKSLEASLPTVAERLSGRTRYETAIDIATKKFNTNKIFLANGEHWMDALVIGPVGGILDMPILLTQANSAPQSLKDYIAKERIQKITAIGGRTMVSDRVLNELSK